MKPRRLPRYFPLTIAVLIFTLMVDNVVTMAGQQRTVTKTVQTWTPAVETVQYATTAAPQSFQQPFESQVRYLIPRRSAVYYVAQPPVNYQQFQQPPQQSAAVPTDNQYAAPQTCQCGPNCPCRAATIANSSDPPPAATSAPQPSPVYYRTVQKVRTVHRR